MAENWPRSSTARWRWRHARLRTLPFWLALAGVVTAYVFYMVKPASRRRSRRPSSPIVTILENKYYMDWINENIVRGAARGLGRGLWKGGDVA